MKKACSILAAVVLAFCLTACVGVNPLAPKKLDGEVGDTLSNMFLTGPSTVRTIWMSMRDIRRLTGISWWFAM